MSAKGLAAIFVAFEQSPSVKLRSVNLSGNSFKRDGTEALVSLLVSPQALKVCACVRLWSEGVGVGVGRWVLPGGGDDCRTRRVTQRVVKGCKGGGCGVGNPLFRCLIICAGCRGALPESLVPFFFFFFSFSFFPLCGPPTSHPWLETTHQIKPRGQVRALILSGTQLAVTSLAPAVEHLSKLAVLDISHNQIADSASMVLANAIRRPPVTDVDLSACRISNRFPCL